MLSPGVAEHLAALLAGRWEDVALSSPAVVRQASGIAAAHLQWHLERDLRSLPLVDRDGAHPAPHGTTHVTDHREESRARTAQIS